MDRYVLCSIIYTVSDLALALIQHVTMIIDPWPSNKNQYETMNQMWIQNLDNQLTNELLFEFEMAKKFITNMKNEIK